MIGADFVYSSAISVAATEVTPSSSARASESASLTSSTMRCHVSTDVRRGTDATRRDDDAHRAHLGGGDGGQQVGAGHLARVHVGLGTHRDRRRDELAQAAAVEAVGCLGRPTHRAVVDHPLDSGEAACDSLDRSNQDLLARLDVGQRERVNDVGARRERDVDDLRDVARGDEEQVRVTRARGDRRS